MPWLSVTLGDVCEFKYGKALRADAREPGGVPVYGSNGRVGDHDVALTNGPTVVVGRKGSVGEVHFSDSPCWPIDTTYFIDNTATEANLRWLAHRLRSLGLTNMNKAAAVPGLNRDDAYRAVLLLPPAKEQHRIADILDRADALRSKRLAAVSLLDDLTKSIFIEMFGDPHTPSVWESQTLAAVAAEINDCPHSTPVWSSSGVTCLRTSNLTVGDWDWTDHRFVSEETYVERSRRGDLAAGDIVLSREGTVGVAAIVPEGLRMCMGQRLVQVRPDRRVMRSDFLLHFLLSVLAPERISGVMVGSTARHLNVRELKLLRIPVPPIQLQERYAERVRAVTGIVEQSRAHVVHIDDTFSSLRQRAFAGLL